MENYMKTTMVTYKGKGGTWHVFEDRVNAKSSRKTEGRVDKMAIFLQPERKTDTGIAFYCTANLVRLHLLF